MEEDHVLSGGGAATPALYLQVESRTKLAAYRLKNRHRWTYQEVAIDAQGKCILNMQSDRSTDLTPGNS